MLSIDKINSNSSFASAKRFKGFGSDLDAKKAYFEMNKDIYADYVDGDISLIALLADKFKNLWSVLTNKNPQLEIKAKIIEKNLLSQAQKDLVASRRLDVAA